MKIAGTTTSFLSPVDDKETQSCTLASSSQEFLIIEGGTLKRLQISSHLKLKQVLK